MARPKSIASNNSQNNSTATIDKTVSTDHACRGHLPGGVRVLSNPDQKTGPKKLGFDGVSPNPAYANIPGFCNTTAENAAKGHVLMPGRYVVAKGVEDDSTESRTLAALRDTLLPKLLSGELSIQGSTI